MNAPILRRTKSDWLAVGVITAIAAVAVGISVTTSDISHASLQQANPPGAEHQAEFLDAAPESVTEAFRVPNAGDPREYKPEMRQCQVMSNDDHDVRATSPDGSTAQVT